MESELQEWIREDSVDGTFVAAVHMLPGTYRGTLI